jgi:hygromycin-B 7''-O-kinase
MTASLPAFTDYETFAAFRADPSQWLPIARDIVASHGLACAAPHVFATGTNIVLALDEKLILKLFPPLLRAQFVSERGSLAQLQGQLRIAIPEIVAEGERDGWPYLVITRLDGVLGAQAWPSLPEADKERVLAEIGSNLTGPASCAGKSRAAAPGMSGSDCRQNFSTDWTGCCAMLRR